MSFLSNLITVAPNQLLSRPGDKLIAEITPKGNEVIKLITSQGRRSAVRYPGTGTIVETIVHRVPK